MLRCFTKILCSWLAEAACGSKMQRERVIWIFTTTFLAWGTRTRRVVANLLEQAAKLNVHSRYLHEGVVDYVERLVALHHDGIESAILGCSGTEATEMALTLARTVTGKRGIICTDATYHGNSSLVGRLSGLPVGVERNGIKSIATPQLFRPITEGLSERIVARTS